MTDLSTSQPGTRHDERRVITVLFADLVGSTALAEHLDPEEVRLVVGEAIERIVGVIGEFDGYVKDLAGDGVLAFFGAPVGHEDDAERAVRTALAITDEIGRYAGEVRNAWGVESFAVRVGVHTGPVVLGDIGGPERVEYAAFGDTVNTAARLQSAADPGEVLVGQATRRFVEPLFSWDDPRDLELKGKAETVRVSPVHGPAAEGADHRRPSPASPLVGRERELAALEPALTAALDGIGGIVFITGEAGIGKSRLLAELRDRFMASAPRVGHPTWLEGHCVSYGETLPYWPVRDLLRRWLGLGGDDPELRNRVALRREVERLFNERAAEVYPYLAALLGLTLDAEARGRITQLSPESLQYRTFEVMRELVMRLAEEGPVVLALDDFHWSDPTSLAMAASLLTVADEAAILLIVTARSERDHPAWRLREDASRELPHRFVEIGLDALGQEADRLLLETLLEGSTLPPDLERRVLDDAEGNPFYLEELVRSLVDAGALVREGSGYRFDHEVPLEVPETVEQVIRARIDRVPTAGQRVLTAASVLGRTFSLPLLEHLADADGGLQPAIAQLQRLDLIRETRRWPEAEYRFKHALIQEAAYRTLVGRSRRELHRRAAEWLEGEADSGRREIDLGMLAHHWRAADDEEKAIRYIGLAGDRAREEHALDEAIDHYRSLVPLLERRGERRQIALVLFKLALSLHTALRFAEANATYQQAFTFWDGHESYRRPPSVTLHVQPPLLDFVRDPRDAIGWASIRLLMQLFDRLVEAGPQQMILPSLAERWEISSDGLDYVFHLRDDAAWSDGTPLTAHDVEYGIKRVLDPATPGASVSIYYALENAQAYNQAREADPSRVGVRAIDSHTVRFRLAAPAPYFLSVLNRPDGGPQPRHAIERYGEHWTDPEVMVTSGPFHIASWGTDQVVLERRRDYGGRRSGNVGRVELSRRPAEAGEPSADTADLDILLPSAMPAASHGSAGDVRLGPAAFSIFLALDHTRQPTADPEFRRALAYATDRNAVAAVLTADMVPASGGLVPPALQGHTADIAPRFDLDAARASLARVGAPPDIELMVEDERDTRLYEALRPAWERIGIRVSAVRRASREALVTYAPVMGLGHVGVYGWLPGYPDPEYFLRLLLHSASRTNPSGYSDPAFDELIERARQERDGRARLELYHAADRLAVAEHIAVIPLAYARSLAFVRPRVHGWWEFGKMCASFADLVVDEP